MAGRRICGNVAFSHLKPRQISRREDGRLRASPPRTVDDGRTRFIEAVASALPPRGGERNRAFPTERDDAVRDPHSPSTWGGPAPTVRPPGGERGLRPFGLRSRVSRLALVVPSGRGRGDNRPSSVSRCHRVPPLGRVLSLGVYQSCNPEGGTRYPRASGVLLLAFRSSRRTFGVKDSTPVIAAHPTAVNSKSAARKGLRVQVSSPALP
jgi:hypothetical protein